MKASKVFPAAMAMDVMGPEVRELAAKAPMYIPGQSRGPQIRSAAIARPVGGQTGLALAFSVANSLRLLNATAM